jgi:hypothetical protein
MKRKVRITPPDSNPFESNNMSTWMAQMGGAQPKQKNQIVYAAAEMLSQGIPQDEVVATLTEQGIPVAIIDEVMNSLYQYVEEQRDLSEANYFEDELTQEQILADQEMAQRDMMYEQDMSEDNSPMYYSPDTDPGYAEEDAVMDEVLMKFGGKIPTKGQYIKKQLKLKRKQEGGPEESNKADDTLSEKRPINKFIQKITEIAQEKSDKESLEEEYNQMFGDEELPEAQFGGARNARRAQRQLNRATRKMNRMLPNGFNALSQFMPSQPNMVGNIGMFPQNFGINPMMGQNLQLANIDVRRSGLFGKPKEYTINFNTTPPVKNDYKDLVKQEEKNVETTVKEIEEGEKEKETTTASTENKKVQEELITADQIQVVGSGKNKTQNTTSTKPQLKKDAWGRSEGDEWYGFDPESKQYTTDAPYQNFENSPFAYKSLREQTANSDLPYIDGQYLDGKPGYDYYRENNKWYYNKLQPDGTYPSGAGNYVTNQETLNRLNQGELSGKGSKNSYLWALPSKSGYYYRQTNTGDFLKFKGNPDNHSANNKPISTIKVGDKNFDYLLENSEYAGRANMPKTGKSTASTSNSSIFQNPYLKFANNFLFQKGGFTDQNSGLYKFIGGGDDSMIPFADESFRTDSKDTTDPYFRQGGLTKYQKTGETKDQYDRSQGIIMEYPYDSMYDVWDGEKWVAPSGSTDNKTNTNTTKEISTNKKKYDALKELGVNVGEYRDGIKYEDLHKFPKMVNSDSSQKENYPKMVNSGYYNPQIGAMYPPLFGGRRKFRPPGRAIEYAGTWAQQQGLAFDPRTGKPVMGMPSSNAPISKIDVTKSSLLRKRPKEYTVYYGNQGTGQAPTTASKRSGSKASDSNESQDQLRQYSGLQNVLAQIPGLSKFVNDPKGDYVSADGMVSPEDYQQPKLPLRRDLLPTIADEAREPIVRDFSTSNNTSPLNPELLPTQDYTDEELKELGMDEIVDVQPEDLSQYANQFSTVNNLPIKRPYSEEQAQMLQNFAPYMKEDSYSKINELDRIEAQDFELEKLMNQDRPLNTFAGNMADYDLGNSNIPINMPGSDPYNAEIKRQEAARRNIEKQKEQVKNQTRREVKQQDNSLTTEPTVTKPVTAKPMTRAQRISDQKKINRIQQITELLSQFQPDWYKETLQEERESLSKGDFSKTPSWFLRQYGGANYTYPQLPVAQTMGQFNMSTPYANKNTDISPDDSQIPIMKPKSSKEVWANTEPQIRESWGLEPKTEPELQYDPYAVKYKNRDMYNVDFEKGVNKFNFRVNQGLGILGERGDKQSMADMQNNLTADNLYGITNIQKRGTYDPNSGLRTPDQMGFTGVAQYGGYMQEGGDMYDDDSVTWMSEDQVRQFLAEGGELEFIQE